MKKQDEDIVACRRRTSIGGQALLEGIMMRGPKVTAMAVRNPEGEIVIEKFPTVGKTRPRFCKWPIIRGVVNFADTLAFGYKCLMRSAEIAGLDEDTDTEKDKKKKKKEESTAQPETAECEAEKTAEVLRDSVATTEEGGETAEAVSAAKTAEPTELTEPVEAVKDTDAANDTEKKEKKEENKGFWALVSILSAVLSVVLVVGLFIWLPAQIYNWLPDQPFSPDNRYLRSVIEGLCKVILLVGYMASVSLMKDIRRTFMFHGAEHKTIFCYEAGLELTVENVRKMKRFHPRCGTSFLIILVLVSIFIGFLIPTELPIAARVAIKLALVPLIVGIGYELIKFAGRHDNIITKIISFPGLGFQRLTVFEPDDGMIECAIAAVKEVIPDDGSDRW